MSCDVTPRPAPPHLPAFVACCGFGAAEPFPCPPRLELFTKAETWVQPDGAQARGPSRGLGSESLCGRRGNCWLPAGFLNPAVPGESSGPSRMWGSVVGRAQVRGSKHSCSDVGPQGLMLLLLFFFLIFFKVTLVNEIQ